MECGSGHRDQRPSFFYAIDEKAKTLDEFCCFDTAKDLETIILSFLSGELETYVYAGTETLVRLLDYPHVSEIYGNTAPDGSIETLMERLSVAADANAQWAGKMEKIYRALALAVGKEK